MPLLLPPAMAKLEPTALVTGLILRDLQYSGYGQFIVMKPFKYANKVGYGCNSAYPLCMQQTRKSFRIGASPEM